MLVNQLSLVIIFRMCLAIKAGESLGGLICFEAQVKLLLMLCLFRVTQPLIAEHEIVVGLKVFRVDAQYAL